jgi:membrane protein YdbS with pleckstrin-like domain
MRPPPRQQLSDRAVAAWRVDGLKAALLQGLVLLFAIGLVVQNTWLTLVLGCVGLAVITLVSVVVAPRVYARTWRYEISEHEVYIQSGLFTVTRHIVPFRRIENVDTVQGPIDKRFGLSSVTVSTTGGKATIPHLDEPVALALREMISARSLAARGQHNAA